MLTEEQWKRVSLGDFDRLIEEAAGDAELIQYYESCRGHLLSKETFKERYKYGNTDEISFPFEYINNAIDSRLQAILRYIQKYNVSSILDIGSRACFLPFYALRNNIIKSAVGIEIDTRFYNLCKRAIQHFNIQGIEIYNCLFEEFDSDEKFDAILLTDTLEHVIDPQLIINKSVNFLKNKDSILITSLPVDRIPVSDFEKKVITDMVTQEHVHLIKKADMINMASIAGYRHIEMETLTSFFLTDISVFKLN
jgi:2-polyprenyl-3-methyl-5-hydroxy-6-metoxy-1,4-benzoquinol methylase